MTQEEKFEEAKRLYGIANADQRYVLESLFPELRESEDERIKNWIRKELESKYVVDNIVNNVMADKALAWLEKQGEQKHDDKVEPKFKVGDTMRTLQEAKDGWTDGMPVVVSIDKEYYHCTNELIPIKDQDDYEFPPMNRIQPQPQWKPSDEQMKALNYYLKNDIDNDGVFGSQLVTLYQDLLKLRKK